MPENPHISPTAVEPCSSAWITDSTGLAVQHLAYMPWGEPYVTQKTGSFNPTYTFSGKERDEETGYSYFGQRFYDSDHSPSI